MEVSKLHVLDLLNRHEIEYMLREHEAVHTMAQAEGLHLPDADSIAKNLFIRDDRKQSYYLLCVRKEKHVALNAIREKLGARRLSLASEQELKELLGLSIGSVTPFGVFHDSRRFIPVLIDVDFQEKWIGVHPNTNTATVWLPANDLFWLISGYGHPVHWIAI